MKNSGFDTIVSAQHINDILLHGATTPTLVARAQKIAQQWETDVLREYGGYKVMTGMLLRALLDHASRDTILGYESSTSADMNVSGERYTAAVLLCAHEHTESDIRTATASATPVNGDGAKQVRAVALAWLDGMLFNGKAKSVYRRHPC